MNIDNIGKFIKKLREDKRLTQEQLAEMIPISRQAVSKWERGLAIPDSSVLIRLSEIFSITINEILSGQKITKENEKEINQLSLKLFKDSNKKRKTIKALVFILIIFAFTFLIYYFITSYRSIKVYTVSGSSKNIVFNDGIFVKTNEKLFFRIGNFNNINNNEEIENLLLYYINEKGKKIEIISTNGDSIMFTDYKGYDEYFESKKINYIIKNMYLKITYKSFNEIIKLNFDENYINDIFFITNNTNVDKNKSKKIESILDFKDIELIEQIKSVYKLKDSNYLYKTQNEKEIIEIYYFDDSNVIKLINYDINNNIIENWIYQINSNIITYQNYKENKFYLFKDNKCDCKNCNENELENIINNFYNEISESLENS